MRLCTHFTLSTGLRRLYDYQTDGEDLLNKCLMDIASRMADEMGLSDAEA